MVGMYLSAVPENGTGTKPLSYLCSEVYMYRNGIFVAFEAVRKEIDMTKKPLYVTYSNVG